MTMREKLIEAAVNALRVVGHRQHMEAVLDAILTTLREPDEGMQRAAFKDAFEKYAHLMGADGAQVMAQDDAIAIELECEAFTAMIDHIRSGR